MPTLLSPATIAGLGALEARATRVESLTFLRFNQASGVDDPVGPQAVVVSLRPGPAPRVASEGALAAPVDGRLMVPLGDATLLAATGDRVALDGRWATIGRVQRLPGYRTVAEFTFDAGVP